MSQVFRQNLAPTTSNSPRSKPSPSRRRHHDPTLQGQRNQAIYFAEVGQFGQVEAETIVGNSTTGYVQVNSLTTGQRDALTAANGMIIYNSTDSKLQGYEGGAWANLI